MISKYLRTKTTARHRSHRSIHFLLASHWR